MKKLTFLLLAFFCSVVYGQDTLRMKCYNSSILGGLTYEVPVTEKLSDTSIVRKFNQGFDLFFDGQTDEAISIWKKIVATSKDIQSNVYGTSYFYVADAYFGTKQADSAEVWFKKILASSLIDSTETGDFREPYGNYKYNSCKRLSSIYGFYKVDYAKAIVYIDSAENNYTYHGSSGSITSIMKQKAASVKWKAKMLYASYKDEDAMFFLLNELYKTDYPEYFEDPNSYLVSIIKEKKINQEYIKELDKALDKLTVETKGNFVTGSFVFRGNTYSATVAKDKKDTIHFDNSPIIKGSEVIDKNKDYFANRIKNSTIYKSLNDGK